MGMDRLNDFSGTMEMGTVHYVRKQWMNDET